PAGELWTAVNEVSTPGVYWFYQQDQFGTGYPGTVFSVVTFANHALGREPVRINTNHAAAFTAFTSTAMKTYQYSNNLLPKTFAGAVSLCEGNSCEKHPSYSQEAAPAYDQNWFAEAHPRILIGNASYTNITNRATHVTGDLWKYNFVGGFDLSPKHYDAAAWSGND